MKQFQQHIKTLTQGSRLSILVGLILIGAGYAQAQFVPPAGAPPTCTPGTSGCEVPLNTGSTAQTKKGDITISPTGAPSNGLKLLGDGTIWSYTGIFGADSPALFTGSATFTAPVAVKNKLTIAPPGTADSSALQVPGASFNIATPNAGFLPPRVTDPTTITTALTGTCDSGQKKNANGLIVYNTSASKLQQWKCTSGANGTWEDIGGAPASGSSTYDGPWFHAYWSDVGYNCVSYAAGCGSQTTPFTIPFDVEVSDFDPAGGSYGYNPSTGTWKPSVSGVYVIQAAITNYNSNLTAVLSRRRSGVVSDVISAISAGASTQPGFPLNLMAVVDVTSGDEFFVRIIGDGSGIGMNNAAITGKPGAAYTASGTFFQGYRIPGGPVNLTTQTQTVSAPAGAVMYFDSDTCPTDWTPYDPLRGRYAVGVVAGSQTTANIGLNGLVGQALTNKENRPVGQHRHFYTAVDDNGGGSHGSLKRYNRNGANDATTYSGQVETDGGGVAGTNAPYVQLLACKKS